MRDKKTEIDSPYLNQLLESIERKSKGIKHSFREWSYTAAKEQDGERIELLFELWSKKPSRLTIWVWDDGDLSLDLRTYAKHDGWEFERRIDGTLGEHKFEELITLIKGISLYFTESEAGKLDELVAGLAK